MPLTIRPAEPADTNAVAKLLVADAEERRAVDPGLWRLHPAAPEKTFSTIKSVMEALEAPFRQQWLVAETAGKLVGVTHSILLPVPPIYAGEFGPPGLIMEDCFVAQSAPPGTRRDLLKAAEDDLIGAGALVLLASSVAGGVWQIEYAARGYVPLTRYLAKTGLARQTTFLHVRQAAENDVPGIVTASAAHRRILQGLNPLFWKPHDDADARFEAWMKRSLTLQDRDMFVSDDDAAISGYAISQPATPLHFPSPHDISGVGIVDDFFHEAVEDPRKPGSTGASATALFSAAEAARASRGDHSVMVVCPAGWHSKIEMLELLGYRNALTWHIKMAGESSGPESA